MILFSRPLSFRMIQWSFLWTLNLMSFCLALQLEYSFLVFYPLLMIQSVGVISDSWAQVSLLPNDMLICMVGLLRRLLESCIYVDWFSCLIFPCSIPLTCSGFDDIPDIHIVSIIITLYLRNLKQTLSSNIYNYSCWQLLYLSISKMNNWSCSL